MIDNQERSDWDTGTDRGLWLRGAAIWGLTAAFWITMLVLAVRAWRG